jgi:hypothetical protein
MNFRRWNYNCAFYYYCLIVEKIYKINKSNRMGNLPVLLLNVTALVSRFFPKICVVVTTGNNFSILAKFTDVYCNC